MRAPTFRVRLILPCPPDPEEFESPTSVEVETDAEGNPAVVRPPASDAE